MLLIDLYPAVRRYVTNEASIETYEVPVDVKVEVLIGLVLSVIGTLAVWTSEVGNIDLLNFF